MYRFDVVCCWLVVFLFEKKIEIGVEKSGRMLFVLCLRAQTQLSSQQSLYVKCMTICIIFFYFILLFARAVHFSQMSVIFAVVVAIAIDDFQF